MVDTHVQKFLKCTPYLMSRSQADCSGNDLSLLLASSALFFSSAPEIKILSMRVN